MPEFNFMSENEDLLLLIQELLNLGFSIVIDDKYDDPVWKNVRSLEDVQIGLDDTILYYLVHEIWQPAALEMDYFEDDNGEKKFYIMKKKGGPAIEFYHTGEFVDEGKRCVGTGFVAYYNTTWNREITKETEAPEALKKLYKKIISIVKKDSIKIKHYNRVYYVKKKTFVKIENGSLHIC